MYCHTTPEIIIEKQILTFQWKRLHFYKYTIFNHYGEYVPSFIPFTLKPNGVKGNFTKKFQIISKYYEKNCTLQTFCQRDYIWMVTP